MFQLVGPDTVKLRGPYVDVLLHGFVYQWLTQDKGKVHLYSTGSRISRFGGDVRHRQGRRSA